MTRTTQDKFSGFTPNVIEEVWFRGYHSDIGGGNENEGLSDIAHYWMYQRALNAGLDFDPALIGAAEQGRDPGAKPKTPAMDRRANKKRTIRETDRVHDSVTRILKAGRFEANNPPRGLCVAGDDIGAAPRKFQE